MARHLLSSATRSCIRKSEFVSPPSLCQAIKRYSQTKEKDDHVIGERARSTAEEFGRVAKEKAETVSKTVKNTWDSAKEAVAGESDMESAKHEYKKTIEKGNYDKMGKDQL